MKNVVFVTTTLYTKWLSYQKKIIKSLFPSSQYIIVDGQKDWPNSWFYWIDEVKKTDCEYFIHVDEDFFLQSKKDLKKAIEMMDEYDLVGIPDGYHHYRGANPIAINTFLMIGKIEILRKINLSGIKFRYDQNLGWINNKNLKYKDSYSIDWNYEFTKNGQSNFKFEQEPYYAFMWAMKEAGAKFGYLYPHFDEKFKSTNPRISENSKDIGIHMWYTRNWNSNMDVWGIPNCKRYEMIESYLLDYSRNLT